MTFRRVGTVVLAAWLLRPTLASASPESAIFDLHKDWRVKELADYNLGGYVNYRDALCLGYMWSGINAHRFHISVAAEPLQMVRAGITSEGGDGGHKGPPLPRVVLWERCAVDGPEGPSLTQRGHGTP